MRLPFLENGLTAFLFDTQRALIYNSSTAQDKVSVWR